MSQGNVRPGDAARSERKVFRISTLVNTVILALFASLFLMPVLLTAVNSIMTEQEIQLNNAALGQLDADTFVNLKWIPDTVSLEQFKTILIGTPQFLRMFWNSVFLVVPMILGQAVVASLAAYAFTKLRFRGRDALFYVYLLTMLMPFQVTMVPNYIVADWLGWINTPASIIGPGIFAAFGVFLMRQFLMNIPYAYIEAGKMDGAGHLRIFTSILLPMIKPGAAALVLLLFVDYWNMVEQPLIFLHDTIKQPLSVYLSRLRGDYIGIAYASSVIYMAPMILLFLNAEPYFIKGVQLSGIKG
ncbi:carbohydrate ABC transporter permease [Paenibacillus thiaminolyticus]|uniref:Carbohydrate ABC transporter permease n=2 Tax=Paenibacillus thiaminolyticus TaxID=49283 RepID=A0AAP9J2A2_PANTH|nr:carbohydrate ABC transporter permease [Paenibacillus thiaminolyticus]SUA50365.1 binding-protein-dependent transport system inner membrane protein [Paenibacillus thiaminolyticus]